MRKICETKQNLYHEQNLATSSLYFHPMVQVPTQFCMGREKLGSKVIRGARTEVSWQGAW